MTISARRAHRILSVQRHLRRMEEWAMMDLERRLAEIEDSQREVIAALNKDEALQGLFVAAAARRLAKLSAEAEVVARAKELQAGRLAERQGQVRRAERLASSADREEEQKASERQLLDIIETASLRLASLR